MLGMPGAIREKTLLSEIMQARFILGNVTEANAYTMDLKGENSMRAEAKQMCQFFKGLARLTHLAISICYGWKVP